MKVNMRRALTSFLLINPLVLHQSIASDLSYSYIEIAYIESDTDVDGIDIDGDGFGFLISNDVAENLAISFSYQDEEFDFDFEGEALSFGLEYHTPFSETGDFVIGFSVVDVEISQPILGTEDDTGNVIQFGIRNRMSETAEIGAFVSRTDVFDDTETSYGLNFALGVADSIQLTFGYGTSDDTDVISIGVRAHY